MDHIPGGANPTGGPQKQLKKSEIIINASIFPVYPVHGHRNWSLSRLGKGPLWAGQQSIAVLTSESDRHLHSSPHRQPAEKPGEPHGHRTTRKLSQGSNQEPAACESTVLSDPPDSNCIYSVFSKENKETLHNST